MKKTNRNGTIDFLKFIFAIVIVCYHSFRFPSELETIFCGGSIAVEFFFVVSGFLMAKSALKYKDQTQIGANTKDFIFKRIKGLCPEILVAWIIGFIVQESIKEVNNLEMMLEDLQTGIFELSFLRMSGISGFHANSVTWYLSAMLLAMLILFPLLIKNRDRFLNIIAPLLTIFILGYLCETTGKLGGSTKWMGLCYKGSLRAIAELSLGCICYCIYEKLSSFTYTVFAKIVFTIVEWFCYLYPLYWMYGNKSSRKDFVLLLFLSIGIIFSFSNITYSGVIFSNKVSVFLGKYSFAIYIGHNYWRNACMVWFADYSYYHLMKIYLGMVFATGLFIILVSYGLRKSIPLAKKLWHNMMLAKK